MELLTLVLALLIVAAWAFDRAERPFSAGACVGLAAAIKLFPAYLVVYFLARRRWRAVIGMTIVFLTANLAAALVLGGQCFIDYVLIVLPSMEKFRGYGYNLALAGFWHKLFDPASELGRYALLPPNSALARFGTLTCDLLVTGLVTSIALRARSRSERDQAFGLTITAMLLVSPITWGYTLPTLLVPIAVLLRAAIQSPRALVALMPALIVLALPPQFACEILAFGRPLEKVSPGLLLAAVSLGSVALVTLFASSALQFRAGARSRSRSRATIPAVTKPASASALPFASD